MEGSLSNSERSSRGNSIKDLGTSQSSLKSTKSIEKGSKSEKSSVQIKNETTIIDDDNQKTNNTDVSLKVPHKFIANWRQACDRTKDRTKDLLKRWRTLPEFEAENAKKIHEEKAEAKQESGWSVHVWTTWVDRFSVESDTDHKDDCRLTQVQIDKFSYFFVQLLDHDKDNIISEQDFQILIERLRHFADWSENSQEFNILREVERGFIKTFLHEMDDEKLGFTINDQVYLTKQGWLSRWSQLTYTSRNLNDFPIWLQIFGKILFQIINRSGTGIISRDELSAFYSSVLELDAVKVGEILDFAYQALTSNGDHPLIYRAYRLGFANYLLGKHPNGPGQYILGAPSFTLSSAMFPIDYSALNAQPEDLEQYTPDQKSNRRSVIV